MGRHSDWLPYPVALSQAGAGYFTRREKNPYSLPFLSFWVALAIVLVSVLVPDSPAAANDAPPVGSNAGVQHLPNSGTSDFGHYEKTVVRDGYEVTRRPVVPVASTPDASAAQAIAYRMVQDRGWSDDEFTCLVDLWNRESHWNVHAENASSGAYGIPQSLPGSKMASAGADWATNPATQITWGLGYIQGRYGTPCGAWAASEEKGWY